MLQHPTKRLTRGFGALVALAAGIWFGGAALASTSASAAGAIAPTIYVANTGNGVPETVTGYPLPSSGNTPPSTTLSWLFSMP